MLGIVFFYIKETVITWGHSWIFTSKFKRERRAGWMGRVCESSPGPAPPLQVTVDIKIQLGIALCLVLFILKKLTIPSAGHWGAGFKKPTVVVFKNPTSLVESAGMAH